MSLPDLHWTWIAAPLAAVLLLGTTMFLRRRRDPYGEHRSRSRRDHAPAHEPGPAGSGPGTTQSGGQRALVQAANEVRNALDQQSRQMAELRTFWSRRLDELDRKIGALAAVPPGRREGEPEPRAAQDRFSPHGGARGGYAAPYDPGTYGAESRGRVPAGGEGGTGGSAWSPGPGDQPVEVRDGVLVVSRSLPPAGYLSVAASGEARVYLNAEVQLTEFSLPKWSAFFDLEGARAYAAYRTRRPAAVRWDEGAGRGELISKGLAEAM